MAYGDIVSLPASITFESTWCPSQNVILVGPGVVAVFHQGNSATHPWGMVKTYPIDAAGNIGTIIDSYTYAPSDFNGASPHPIHVANDIYAVTAQGYVGGGYVSVWTLQIAADGTITHSVIGSINLYSMSNMRPHIARLGDTNTYVVCSHISGNDGYMATLNINEDGTGLAKLDEWEYDPANGYFANCAYVENNYFLMAHQGEVCTIYVANNGAITKSLASSISDGAIYKAEIRHLAGNIYAVFNEATIRTYSVSDTGILTAIGSFTYASGALEPGVAGIGKFGGLNYFAIAYHVSGYIGWLRTLSINDAGDTFANIDDYNFGAPPPYVVGNHSVFIDGNIYAVTYNDSGGNSGTLYTVEIDTPPLVLPAQGSIPHRLMSAGIL